MYSVFRALQLSEGGLLFEAPTDGAGQFEGDADHAFPVGAKIVISLLLPDGVGIVVRGKTIYHEKPRSEVAGGGQVGIGVKFDSVALNHRRAIRNFVSSKPVGELER